MFKNQVALVTGGSRGIGRAVSLKLAGLGAHVYVNYTSRPDAAEETVSACKAVGGTAEAIGFNVAVSAEVDKAVDAIKEKSGKLDILVNNAGISRDGLILRFKDEDWLSTINTNLSGAFYCARAAAKIMMRAKYGRIVNISSVTGETGNAGQVAYSASKSGLFGLTKSLAKELASRNITINSITPGFIETDMTGALDDKTKESILGSIPLGRYGKPEEVADLVLFLASSQSSYITGQVIGINGGMHM